MLWQEWSKQRLNAVGNLVADIIVETLQGATSSIVTTSRTSRRC